MSVSPEDVIRFWFEDHGEDDWFASKPAFDAKVQQQFAETCAAAQRGELSGWRDTIEGRLAEIIVLDQFSRQLYRGEPRAFAGDPIALTLAQEAVRHPDIKSLESDRYMFVLMPFMHSESLEVHRQAAPLFEAYGSENLSKFEKAHCDVLEQFGRYPKRNEAMGRETTPEEQDYISGRDGHHF